MNFICKFWISCVAVFILQGPVEVAGNIVVAEGRTVAGVDVSTLPGRVVTVDEQQTLQGEVVSVWWYVSVC